MNTQEKHTHTPGPWRTNGCLVTANGDWGSPVCTCVSTEDAWGNHKFAAAKSLEGAIANARLIAAAPELLAALEAFNDAYEAKWGDLDVWLDFMAKASGQAKLAIAKARGEQH